MTLVNMVYRRPDGVHAEGTLLTAADGSVAISSVRRYDTSDGEMTRVAFTVPLNTQNVFMDPGTWQFELIGVSDGKGGYLSGDDAISTRIVPASGTFDVDDLTETTGSSGQGLAPEWKAYIDAAIAALTVGPGGTPTGSGPGGAFVIADVTDSTTVGRSLVKAATTAAALTAIGAAAAANPVFTGTVTIPDNALAIADTSGLQAALDAKAPLASPAFTGNPTAPTPTAGDNDTSIATTAFVTTAVAGVTSGGGGAPLASPAFTGVPTAPTATAGTNTTQLATTAFTTTAVAVNSTRLDDHDTLIASLTARVQELEENGANMSAIFGAASVRNNPLTGTAFNPGSVVTWLVDGTAPANAVTGDIVLNRVSI